ncbi:hypothetical protein QL285_008128 [Trifolium repens]|nr:hypothetical protein QL285_008128 [Trifolium repens]
MSTSTRRHNYRKCSLPQCPPELPPQPHHTHWIVDVIAGVTAFPAVIDDVASPTKLDGRLGEDDVLFVLMHNPVA